MTTVKPTINLYRGGNQSWMPTWTTSSPSAPEITNFLVGVRIKEAGNYAISEVDLTLKNVTSNIVGVFTDTSRDTEILAKEYFKLVVDDGNVSKVWYGYFGSWESDYMQTPPNVVTFRGRDLRVETHWRTISVDYNKSATNVSDAITHMFDKPDDAPDGTKPLEFILNISGSGLNVVVPESNFARQHPTIFNAAGELLQNLNYEQKLTVNANGSKVLEMYPAGAIYHDPAIIVRAKGVNSLLNNAVRIKNAIDFDDIGNIVGVWSERIDVIPVKTDEWTDDYGSWNDSAWNTSDGALPSECNFSCSLNTKTQPNMAGFNTSYAIYPNLSNANAVNMTVGVSLQFPSNSQSTALTLDYWNARKLRFWVAAPTRMSTEAITVKVRMVDSADKVIQNIGVIRGVLGVQVAGGPNRAYLDSPHTFKQCFIHVNQSERKVAYTEGETAGFDWFNVAGSSFDFDAVKAITFFANENTTSLGISIDNVNFQTDLEVNPRINQSVFPLAVSTSSIDLYQRRFRAIDDNRLISIGDVLARQSTEVEKTENPLRRMQWRSVNALHATTGQLIEVDCPPYGINSNASNHIWRILQVNHNWQTGQPWYTTPDLVGPITTIAGTPSGVLNLLRMGSFDEAEQLAGLIGLLSWQTTLTPRDDRRKGMFDLMNVAAFKEGPIVENDLNNSAVSTVKIQDQAVTSEKLAYLAINASHIANLTITAAQIADNTITAGQIAVQTIVASSIASNTITAGEIASQTITANEIAGNTINASNIANNTIVAGNIASQTITAAEIAYNTINASQINSNTITAGEIAANTITANEIAGNTINASNIADNTIIAGNIGVNTITGGNIAYNTINASNIADNTIIAANIFGNTINASNIADQTIIAGNIAYNAINASHIAAATITAGQIASLTITATQIANLTITGGANGSTSKIANNTIAETNIVANTITAASIAANTITAAEIAANTITANEILANTITANEILANTITANEITTNALVGLDIRTNASVGETGGPAGFRLTSTELAGYSGNTSKTFYVLASDGKLYAAAGNVWLGASGVTIKGSGKLNFQTAGGVASGDIYARGAMELGLAKGGEWWLEAYDATAVLTTRDAGPLYFLGHYWDVVSRDFGASLTWNVTATTPAGQFDFAVEDVVKASLTNLGALTLIGGLTVGSDIVSDTANTDSLGSATKEFANVYIGTGRAYFGLGQGVSIYSGTENYLQLAATYDTVFESPNTNRFVRPGVDDDMYLGAASFKWKVVYRTDESACPLPTSNSALEIIKKIKSPMIAELNYGKRHYFRDEDFPDEMKFVNDEGKLDIELTRTLGVSVQAIREILGKVETLESDNQRVKQVLGIA